MTQSQIVVADAETSPENEAWLDLAVRTFEVGRLTRARFQIRSLEEADKLSAMLASQYPVPERVLTGIWELLSNAVEHGNLEIPFEVKTQFMLSCCYPQEVARRMETPDFASRVVRVGFKRRMRSIRLRICDAGPGFDFAHYVDAPLSQGPTGEAFSSRRSSASTRSSIAGRGNIVDAVIKL